MTRSRLLAALCLLPFFGLTASFSRADDTQVLALVGCKVYPAPNVAPLEDAAIAISGGTITAVGNRNAVDLPRNGRAIDCAGKTVVAGFWNSHVHFTEPAWGNAAAAPAAGLEQHMREMLTRWGVTTVWDLGSNPLNSLPLRGRVESGEIAGPKMLLAGDIFPKGGHPVYLPAETQLPEAATPDEAAQMARNDLQMGLDGMKLFTGAYMGNKPVVNMDPAVAKAAVDVAHAQGRCRSTRQWSSILR
jgi:imidazolonepropionase-like amidohydrolase